MVNLCVRLNVHPDTVSYGSIVASAIACVMFIFSGRAPILLLLAPLMCYLRLWLNMLDGMVALASGKASLRGEVLNDLPDRISDILIFAGVAHSGLCHAALAYWAAMLALLTAYVGIFGQALGGKREFGGVMSKPWRMVVLHLGAWATLGMIWLGRPVTIAGNSPTVLDVACLLVVVGCVQTVWVRLTRILESLRQRRAG